MIKREIAKHAIHRALVNGPRSAIEMQAVAARHNISWLTFKRAKRTLPIRSYQRIGDPHAGWLWELIP